MPDEGFLRRWARLKADPAAAQPAVASPAVAQPVPAPATAEMRPATAGMPAVEPSAPQRTAEGARRAAMPTLDDVARLSADSDFSVFVSKGVDKDVRRMAMKKLFTDPHFNLVDRLDVYMDDYNKPSPMSEAMLAALHHTKNLFAPLASAAKEADADAAVEAGEGAATRATGAADEPDGAAAGEATADAAAGEDVPAGSSASGHATADTTITVEIPSTIAPAAAPIQLEPIPFNGAAAGGVFQQSQQGKA